MRPSTSTWVKLGKCLQWALGPSLCAATIVGCGMLPSASKTKDSSTPKRVLLAILGGNSSCATDDQGRDNSPYAMKMYAPFQQLTKQLEQQFSGLTVDFFLSCHNDDAAVHYFASDNPNELVDTTLEQVPVKLEAMIGAGGPTSLYVAGHSYGGWLAMTTGLALAGKTKVAGLFTIDPISRIECTFSHPSGCTSAPSDIDNDQRQTLHDNSSVWDNFYETGTFYLHSSVIDQATENFKQAGDTHYNICQDDGVWSNVAKTVGAQIKSDLF